MAPPSFLNKTQVKQPNDDGGTFSAAPSHQVKQKLAFAAFNKHKNIKFDNLGK